MHVIQNCLWSVLLPFWHLHSEENIVSIQATPFHFITLTLTLVLSTTPLYPMYFFVEFIALV